MTNHWILGVPYFSDQHYMILYVGRTGETSGNHRKNLIGWQSLQDLPEGDLQQQVSGSGLPGFRHKRMIGRYGGFHGHWGAPSHHPFLEFSLTKTINSGATSMTLVSEKFASSTHSDTVHFGWRDGCRLKPEWKLAKGKKPRTTWQYFAKSDTCWTHLNSCKSEISFGWKAFPLLSFPRLVEMLAIARESDSLTCLKHWIKLWWC